MMSELNVYECTTEIREFFEAFLSSFFSRQKEGEEERFDVLVKRAAACVSVRKFVGLSSPKDRCG